jgi:hypothetical protein
MPQPSGVLELAIDFRKECGQVPGPEVAPRFCSACRALHETPPVLVEIIPIPVSQDSAQDWRCFRRGLFNLGFEACNPLLRSIALNQSLKDNLLPDSFDEFGVSFFLQRRGNDRLKVGDSRLRQALIDSILNGLPLSLTGTALSCRAMVVRSKAAPSNFIESKPLVPTSSYGLFLNAMQLCSSDSGPGPINI